MYSSPVVAHSIARRVSQTGQLPACQTGRDRPHPAAHRVFTARPRCAASGSRHSVVSWRLSLLVDVADFDAEIVVLVEIVVIEMIVVLIEIEIVVIVEVEIVIVGTFHGVPFVLSAWS